MKKTSLALATLLLIAFLATGCGIVIPAAANSVSDPTQPPEENAVVTDAFNRYIKAKTSAYTSVVKKIEQSPSENLPVATALLPVALSDTTLTLMSTLLGGGKLPEAIASGLGITDCTTQVQKVGDAYSFTISYRSSGKSESVRGTYDAATQSLTLSALSEGEPTTFFEFAKVGEGYASQLYTLNTDGKTYNGIHCFFQGSDITFGIRNNVDFEQEGEPNSIYNNPPIDEDSFCEDADTFVQMVNGELNAVL